MNAAVYELLIVIIEKQTDTQKLCHDAENNTVVTTADSNDIT